MNEQEILRKLASLESREDHLVTEIEYLNELLKRVGFQHGITTLKAAAEAIVAQADI
ncbi:MAG: hypothetical protein K940chlam3_00955 [Chlamydiae bacterium]|nr:hypothetical protein [Chlamydiota bacterium]